ncbi:MAG TPA: hypothetical protein VEX41_06580 [Candidatus Eisenbacteria bacterium]|nr:hypothetical protein [Candidatus Eisenbacteria bacterium]
MARARTAAAPLTATAAAGRRTAVTGPSAGPVRIPSERPLDASHIYELQTTAGNAAVSGMIESVDREAATGGLFIQRSEIAFDDPGETLYNQTPDLDPSVAQGAAGAKSYPGSTAADGGGIRFEMTRTPGGVNVTVKIKFVDAARNVAKSAGTAIPEGDERRAFGERMCTTTAEQWNGKLVFASKEHPPADPEASGGVPAPVDVRLPVAFQAVPVWDVAAPAHSTIRLFGTATIADSATGNPIDAGNYYMNKGDYGASSEAIYAHEYGHLLGLNDEYAQSNFQMHKLLHQNSPTLGGGRGQALDRATVERMVLAALTRPLYFRLTSAGQELGKVFRAGKKPLEEGLIGAIAAAAASPALHQGLGLLIAPQAAPKLQARVAKIVDLELGKAFSARTIGHKAVAGEFAAQQLGDTIASQYLAALTAPHDKKADVGGGPSGQIKITIQGSAGGAGAGIWGAGESGALAANATAVAGTTVGAAGTARGVPPVRPATSLIAKIEEIPGVWAAATAAGGGAVSAPHVLGTMLGSAAAGALGLSGPITTAAKLQALTRKVVQTAARNTAIETIRTTIASQLGPIYSTHVSSLQADVAQEVTRIMTTPAAGAAAAAPKDPDLAAVAAAMKTRLDAQTPAGRTDTNPARAGAGAAEPAAGSQEVTYKNTGIMGDNSADVRPDQFKTMVSQFNSITPALRHANEDEFRAEKAAAK